MREKLRNSGKSKKMSEKLTKTNDIIKVAQKISYRFRLFIWKFKFNARNLQHITIILFNWFIKMFCWEMSINLLWHIARLRRLEAIVHGRAWPRPMNSHRRRQIERDKHIYATFYQITTLILVWSWLSIFFFTVL